MSQGQVTKCDDGLAEWQRRQDLYRAYDGPIPPSMMAHLGDGEVQLKGLIRDAEDRASRHEDAAKRWLELGKPEMARRCREDAMLARDTAALNRDALEKLRSDGARPGHDRRADQAGREKQHERHGMH